MSNTNKLLMMIVVAGAACSPSPMTSPDDAGQNDAGKSDGSSCTTKSWTLTDLDPSNSVTRASSLAVDAAGGVHVVYGTEAGLRYGYKAPGADWVFEPLAAGMADTVHIALETSGVVHVTWFEFSSGLHYARRDGNAQWSQQSVTPLVDGAGYNHALAIDATGAAHILYSSNTQTSYARGGGGGSFVIEKLDDTMGSPTDIKVDAGGTVHAVYSPCGSPCGSGYPLTYAHKAPAGPWQRETVDMHNMAEAVLALAGDDVYAAFYLFATSDDELRFATRHGGSWAVEHVDAKSYSTGGELSLAVDGGGGAHLLYFDQDRGDLHHGYRSKAGTWSLETLDMFGVAGEVSALALAPDGALHATYYGCTDQFCEDDAVKYAVSRCE
jgi:hypothetical protein